MRIALTGLSSGALVTRSGQDAPGGGGQGASASGFREILAWSIASTAGAVVRFRDGPLITSEIAATINVPVNSTATTSFWRGLTLYNSALYMELVSGVIEGSVELN